MFTFYVWFPVTLSGCKTWWRHQIEPFSALLAICAGNSPVSGEYSAQRPVTRSFEVFVDLRLNERLIKQSLSWWSETLSCSLWRHSNEKQKAAKRLVGKLLQVHQIMSLFRITYIYVCVCILKCRLFDTKLHSELNWRSRLVVCECLIYIL